MNDGSYVVSCDGCQGSGSDRGCGTLYRLCPKCDGTGVLTVMEPGHDKLNIDAIMGAVGLVLLVTSALLLWAFFG